MENFNMENTFTKYEEDWVVFYPDYINLFKHKIRDDRDVINISTE